jgi:nucleotide-binding universal stress UspA family protein
MIGDLRVHGMPAVMEAIRQQVYDAFQEEFIDTSVGMSRISDIRVVRGAPADVILEEVDISGCDMIVMGSHGHDSGHSAMLGSVVAKVLQLSKVPVLMVPMAQPRFNIAAVQPRAAL